MSQQRITVLYSGEGNFSTKRKYTNIHVLSSPLSFVFFVRSTYYLRATYSNKDVTLRKSFLYINILWLFSTKLYLHI